MLLFNVTGYCRPRTAAAGGDQLHLGFERRAAAGICGVGRGLGFEGGVVGFVGCVGLVGLVGFVGFVGLVGFVGSVGSVGLVGLPFSRSVPGGVVGFAGGWVGVAARATSIRKAVSCTGQSWISRRRRCCWTCGSAGCWMNRLTVCRLWNCNPPSPYALTPATRFRRQRKPIKPLPLAFAPSPSLCPDPLSSTTPPNTGP